MFGFKSISINKVAAAINLISEAVQYYVLKLSGEGTPKNLNTVILDDSQNSYAITNNGSVTQTSFSPFAQNWSTYFGGSADYMILPSGILDFMHTGSTHWTFECWFNTSSTSSQTIISTTGSTAQTGFQITLNGAGDGAITVLIYRSSAGNSYRADTAAGTFTLGVWNHVAITFNATSKQISVFVNGSLRGITITGTAAFSSSTATNAPNIGRFLTASVGPGGYFSGYISNIRVVQGSVEYTSNFTPSTSALTPIANTRLLTCQNAALVDNSVFNTLITSAGAPSTVVFNPFGNSEITVAPPSNSILFDGSSFLEVSRDCVEFGTSNFTIEAWIYLNNLSETALFSRAWSGSNFFFVGGSNGNMDWWVGHPNTNWGRVTTTTAPLKARAWTHVAFTRNLNVFTIWVNGVSVASNTITVGSLNNGDTTPFRIGRYPFSGSPWNGNISNFRIVNGTCLYNSSFIPPTSNLTAVSGTSLLIGVSNTLSDLSSSTRPLTSSGSPRISTMAPFRQSAITTTTAIPTNYSYRFNGSSYIDVSRDCVQFGTGDFTMEAWIYPTSSAEMNIFSRNWSGSNFLLCGISGGVISFWMGHPNSGWVNPSSANTAIKTNQWQHIALTRRGTAVNIWVNGVSVASATSSVNMTSADTTPLTIGRYPFSGSPFSGNISNVRIVNGSCLYSSAFTPPASKLLTVPGTTLLTCQDSTIVDSGPSTRALTTTGTITPQLVDYSYSNSYSVQFNGTTDGITVPGSSSLDLTADFTIELWANVTGVNNWLCNGSQIGSACWNLQMNAATGVVKFQMAIGSWAGVVLTSTSGVFSANTWNHFAITRSGSSFRVFVNGTVVASGTNSGSLINTGRVTQIGFYTDSTGTFRTTGNYSNLRIVKGTALYTAAFTPSTSPLLPVAGTELLACQSNRLIDSSTNNFTLTATGTPAVSTTTPFSVTSTATYPASTLFAGSARFTGNTSLQIPAASSISGTGDFTVDYWIYPTAFASGYTVLFANDTSNGLSMSINSTGTVAFGRSLVATDGTTSNSVNFGCWNHIAICRASGTLRMFINGRQGFSAANSTNFASGVVRIGADGGGTSLYHTGLMSNFRIQRTASYTTNFTPVFTPVISSAANSNTAALLEFNSYGVLDSIGQLPLTSTGTVEVSTVQKKNGNSSLFFNGATNYLSTPTSPLLNIFAGDMTIEAWIYPTSGSLSSRSEHVASLVIDASNRASLYFNGTTFTFWTRAIGDGGGSAARITTTAVTVNQWNHIALVRKNGLFTLLVNGTGVGTSSISVLPTGSPLLRIGTYDGASATDNFTGYIDDFKVFTYAKYTSAFIPS